MVFLILFCAATLPYASSLQPQPCEDVLLLRSARIHTLANGGREQPGSMIATVLGFAEARRDLVWPPATIPCCVETAQSTTCSTTLVKPLAQDLWAFKHFPELSHVQGRLVCTVDLEADILLDSTAPMANMVAMNLTLTVDGGPCRFSVPVYNLEQAARTCQRLSETSVDSREDTVIVRDESLAGKVVGCIAPLFGRPPLLHLWLEYHRFALGLDRLFVYLTEERANPDLARLLDRHASWVTRVPWARRFRTGDLKGQAPHTSHQVAYYSQYLGLNDCAHRASGAEWLFAADHDSFLVPQTGEDLPTYLGRQTRPRHIVMTLFHNCAGRCLQAGQDHYLRALQRQVGNGSLAGSYGQLGQQDEKVGSHHHQYLDSMPWTECPNGLGSNVKTIVHLDMALKSAAADGIIDMMVHQPPLGQPGWSVSVRGIYQAHIKGHSDACIGQKTAVDGSTCPCHRRVHVNATLQL